MTVYLDILSSVQLFDSRRSQASATVHVLKCLIKKQQAHQATHFDPEISRHIYMIWMNTRLSRFVCCYRQSKRVLRGFYSMYLRLTFALPQPAADLM